MTKLSNVPTQPNPNTVERLTLVEKLKHEHDDRELTCQDLFEDGHFDDKKTELLIQQTGVMAGLQIAIDIVEQHSQEVCSWKCNIDTDAWVESSECGDYSSDCGLEWNISNNDSPSENEMNFCPKCGRKLVEIKLPSETQEKIYEQEMDKIKFCGCGCILPDDSDQCSDCGALYDM